MRYSARFFFQLLKLLEHEIHALAINWDARRRSAACCRFSTSSCRSIANTHTHAHIHICNTCSVIDLSVANIFVLHWYRRCGLSSRVCCAASWMSRAASLTFTAYALHCTAITTTTKIYVLHLAFESSAPLPMTSCRRSTVSAQLHSVAFHRKSLAYFRAHRCTLPCACKTLVDCRRFH